MKTKGKIEIPDESFEIGYAVGAAEMIYRNFGIELVVTALREDAVSFRVKNLSATKKSNIYSQLNFLLEYNGFKVTLQEGYILVEFLPDRAIDFTEAVE